MDSFDINPMWATIARLKQHGLYSRVLDPTRLPSQTAGKAAALLHNGDLQRKRISADTPLGIGLVRSDQDDTLVEFASHNILYSVGDQV